MSLDEIAECVPILSFNELKELDTEVMQLVCLIDKDDFIEPQLRLREEAGLKKDTRIVSLDLRTWINK